jgi:aromatic-L-amino-acid decarboxylase
MKAHVDDFRRAGHEVVDWIADYLENSRQYPVLPRMKPGDLIDCLPRSAPEHGEPLAKILEDFHKLILPAVTHWNHPRFMAYFAVSASGPGILGEMLAAAINANGMLWKTSPAGTELEVVTLDWLREWLGLPEQFFGIIYDTASVSTLHAIAAARERADPDAGEKGSSQNLILYTSEQAHSSVEKGAVALGIGRQNVRKIPVDSQFQMRPQALATAVEQDRKAGKKPFCVVATVGTTSTTSVDPVADLASMTQDYGLWLHIDAAYAGAAAILPEFRHILAGAERADSLVVNPHKWLFTPIDLSAFYTRRPDILKRAFSLVPEYLRTEEDSRAVNYMDYGVQLGRRLRALKLWFVLRYFGRKGISEIIRSHIHWAQHVATAIDADHRFERMAPTPFSVVCFRYRGTDEDNRRLLESINASGKAFLSHTVLDGRFVLRLAVGNLGTTQADVEDVWRLLKESAARL